MDLFLAMVPNSLPLFSSSRICFASFSVLTTMTRSKTSSRPLDCALEIVDELNDRNTMMASTSHRLCKSEIVFLAGWLSMAEVDVWNCNQMKLADTCFHVRRLARAAPLCAKHHASGSGGSRGIVESLGFDQTTRRISFDVLRAQGGCCDCEILCNVPSSRGLHNRRIIVQGPAIRIN